MNRIVKIAGITAALAATLLLGGCNEEKKYNALKMEVTNEIEEALKIIVHYDGSFSNDMEYAAAVEKSIVNLEEKEKAIFAKLEKMKELSKDDVNLSNDYLKVRREAQKVTNQKLSQMDRLKKTKYYATH